MIYAPFFARFFFLTIIAFLFDMLSLFVSHEEFSILFVKTINCRTLNDNSISNRLRYRSCISTLHTVFYIFPFRFIVSLTNASI